MWVYIIALWIQNKRFASHNIKYAWCVDFCYVAGFCGVRDIDMVRYFGYTHIQKFFNKQHDLRKFLWDEKWLYRSFLSVWFCSSSFFSLFWGGLTSKGIRLWLRWDFLAGSFHNKIVSSYTPLVGISVHVETFFDLETPFLFHENFVISSVSFLTRHIKGFFEFYSFFSLLYIQKSSKAMLLIDNAKKKESLDTEDIK